MDYHVLLLLCSFPTNKAVITQYSRASVLDCASKGIVNSCSFCNTEKSVKTLHCILNWIKMK